MKLLSGAIIFAAITLAVLSYQQGWAAGVRYPSGMIQLCIHKGSAVIDLQRLGSVYDDVAGTFFAPYEYADESQESGILHSRLNFFATLLGSYTFQSNRQPDWESHMIGVPIWMIALIAVGISIWFFRSKTNRHQGTDVREDKQHLQ